mmetsp:Transcript_34839/g.70475  ORF Transcript_34839/g.70475 Transcript_34839/m.70475 type:complete len:100 (-) Transcript_34839:50-349(-)
MSGSVLEMRIIHKRTISILYDGSKRGGLASPNGSEDFQDEDAVVLNAYLLIFCFSQDLPIYWLRDESRAWCELAMLSDKRTLCVAGTRHTIVVGVAYKI